MIFLQRPKIEDSPETIFENCVKGYSKASGKAEKLLRCKPLVKRDAQRYERLIRQGEPPSELPVDVKSTELHAVYTERFARSGTEGRKKYYNAIKRSVRGKGCPICGEKGKITLDHYLPKSEFPTLCVAPDNLIPICMDCNGEKGTKTASNGYGVPVHLYFDRLPEEKDDPQQEPVKAYLFVRLGPNFEAEYYVECPQKWDADIRDKLTNQMVIYNLRNRFGDFAVIEMGNLQTRWEQGVEDQRRLLEETLLIDTSALDQKKLFRMMLKSDLQKELRIDPNSWKTALYRALYQKADELAEWLEKKKAGQNVTV